MSELTLNVPKINCGHCVHTIQSELSELLGVQKVIASAQTKQVTVTFDKPADEGQIRALLTEINYPAEN